MCCVAWLACAAALAARAADPAPWLDQRLDPDRRAALVVAAMTPDERFVLLHGPMAMAFAGYAKPAGAIGSAGTIPGIPRLGVPALQETDAGLGIANPFNTRPGDTATALPSGLSLAATFDPALAYAAGALIGNEAWSKGFNVLLAGGINLARDPRNGRNFEYLGEDPLLAGTLDGAIISGIQDQHVVSTIKHFAMNDQETGRNVLSADIGDAAMRESDLLAFQIAIGRGHPGAVMCAYNRVNGVYSCANDHLLNGVLKGDWHYAGWVMSDWGAVHDVAAAQAGLDQESGQQLDRQVFFDAPLRQAVAAGAVPEARLRDMNQRILRSMFAVALFDHPPQRGAGVDAAPHRAAVRRAAAAGIVLLRNQANLLPLSTAPRRILVIGGHADAGVLSGGGSSQVVPLGGPALTVPVGGDGAMAAFRGMVFDPSAPLAAMRSAAPQAAISYDDGRYPARAAALAKTADVAIVFATQWQSEGIDVPDLTLPDGQDALIAAVAAANPHTVVVLETGNPVLMPWLPHTAAVLEAWYPGQEGGAAIADVLFGAADAAGRLPITFPADPGQLARPALPGADLPMVPDAHGGMDNPAPFDVTYAEGADVGYRRAAPGRAAPLFTFGFGLSYTSFRHGKLTLTGGDTIHAALDVTNTGTRPGIDTVQLYLAARPGHGGIRLIAFTRVPLGAGEMRHVTLDADPRLLADSTSCCLAIAGGRYGAAIGEDAGHVGPPAAVTLTSRRLAP